MLQAGSYTSTMPSSEPRGPSVAMHMDQLGGALNHAGELAQRLERIADHIAGGGPREVGNNPATPKPSGLVGALNETRDRLNGALASVEASISRIEAALG